MTWDHQLWELMEWLGDVQQHLEQAVCKAVPPHAVYCNPFGFFGTIFLVDPSVSQNRSTQHSHLSCFWLCVWKVSRCLGSRAMFGSLETGTVIFFPSFTILLWKFEVTRDSTVGCNFRCCCCWTWTFEVWFVDIWVVEDIKMLMPRTDCAKNGGLKHKCNRNHEWPLQGSLNFPF